MVVCDCNPSDEEVETRGSPEFTSQWALAAWQVSGPWDILSQKQGGRCQRNDTQG